MMKGYFPIQFILSVMLLGGAVAGPVDSGDLSPVSYHPAPAPPPVILVQDRQPAAVIVAPVKPDRFLCTAILDLQLHLQQITGAKLPIVTRHRVTDKKNCEYQRFNTRYARPSNDQNAFGRLPFIER